MRLLVEPLCGVDFVSLRCAVVGVNASELDVFAEIVAAFLAEETVVAGYARFYGHPVTCRCQLGSYFARQRRWQKYEPTLTSSTPSPHFRTMPEAS